MGKFGDLKSTYVIAELASCHDAQRGRALNLIYLAKEAGADCVKFQLFDAMELAQRRNAADYYHIYKAFELPQRWLSGLAYCAASLGVDLMVTGYSPADIEAISEYTCAFKIASFEMADLGLLAYVRLVCEKTKKKVVLSTGMASMREVGRSLEVVGHDNVAYLLHCASAYPCPPEAINLNAMESMRVLWTQNEPRPWALGLSDHTVSITAPIAAVALGAKCIEKHITDDRNRVGPDHPFAVEPKEFGQMVEMIREVEVELGDGVKEMKEAEREMSKYRVKSEKLEEVKEMEPKPPTQEDLAETRKALESYTKRQRKQNRYV